MGVTYKKLFKLMIDCGLKKKDLQEMACLSPATISKLGRDEYVSMDVLVRICNALKVRIDDIVEVLIED
ncbi:MAG: helix-turn-helix domain-containing protein [Faecousia sp.]